MHFKGTAHRYGRDIDTDVIIPARYLNSSDPEWLAAHCLEDLDKDFVNKVQKGDIIVFRYPMDESVDFIKRVVATPGDRVEYRDKVLYVNGVEQAQSRPRDFVDDSTMVTLEERTENLSGLEHSIAVDHRRPSWVPMQAVMKKEPTCSYNDRGFVCTVPEGKYFAMGDNRDNSEDSRFWGFVPDENLVGKAVCIWANFSDMGRIGSIY